MDDATTHSVLFPDLLSKPFDVCFAAPHLTSDGGAALLKAVDDSLRLTEAMADCIQDPRQSGKVRHSFLDIIRQRTLGLACGYPDANDVARIGQDPMHKLLLNRHPLLGDDLASQPTICRFENGLTRTELYRVGTTMADPMIDHHRRRLPGRKCKLVTLDLEPTDDAAHGAQQLALFNGQDGNYCFLTLLVNVTFNDEPEQYLLTAVLRPGAVHGKVGSGAVLRRLIPQLRLAFPFAQIHVRLDGGFACEEIFALLLEEHPVQYLAAIAGNSVLARRSRRLMGRARRLVRRRKRAVTLYGETFYGARMEKAPAPDLQGRGGVPEGPRAAEQLPVCGDQPSLDSPHHLRHLPHLIKIGGRVEVSARRFVLHLSASRPWQREWRRA